MSKRILLSLIVFCMGILMFVGCDKKEKPNQEVETNIVCNLANITIEELETKIKNEESFYIFIDDKENANENTYQAINDVSTDFVIPIGFYQIDNSNINKEVIETHFNNKEHLVGFYAFENGKICNEMVNIETDDIAALEKQISNFIFESDLFINDMGFEVISYEKVLEKIDSGEKFILYIGRDTCKYCKAFTLSLEDVLKEYPANVPIYYFYTQSYKTAINKGEDGAQETWDNLKETLEITGTPSFHYYDDGKLISAYQGYVESEYFDLSKEEQEQIINEKSDVLEQWFANNKLSDACSDMCD